MSEIDNIENKPLEWYKDQYFLLMEKKHQKMQKSAAYSRKYYSENKERDKQKKGERENIPKPRGRPRKYTDTDQESIHKISKIKTKNDEILELKQEVVLKND